MQISWRPSTLEISMSQSKSATSTSSVLSVSPERSVPPATLEVLQAVDRVTRELGVDYFVLGATARDIVLYGVFGIAPTEEPRTSTSPWQSAIGPISNN